MIKGYVNISLFFLQLELLLIPHMMISEIHTDLFLISMWTSYYLTAV
jgi:hypothetical protein